MTRRTALAIVLAALVGTTGVARILAAEVTHTGVMLCAKCALKKADAHECQDVLIVTAANGDKTEYYVTKNAVSEQAGEACTLEVKARITGEVSEKDGKKWITPSKIEKL